MVGSNMWGDLKPGWKRGRPSVGLGHVGCVEHFLWPRQKQDHSFRVWPSPPLRRRTCPQESFVIWCFSVSIVKVLIPSVCFALACVVTLEMEAIDGVGGRGREERHQHLRKGYHVNTLPTGAEYWKTHFLPRYSTLHYIFACKYFLKNGGFRGEEGNGIT